MNKKEFDNIMMMEVFTLLTKKKRFPKSIDVKLMYSTAMEYFKSYEKFENCKILSQSFNEQ